MQEHPNATAMRRMMEAINQGDMTAMGEQLADDVEWHMIGASEACARQAGVERHDVRGR